MHARPTLLERYRKNVSHTAERVLSGRRSSRL